MSSGMVAVLCANDLLALAALQGLVVGGLRLPEDVAIVATTILTSPLRPRCR